MESDRLDSQVSVDSWAESQMSHRTMSEPFFFFPLAAIIGFVLF